MLFNSVHFLVFFPVVTLVYFVLPHKMRWVWLLVASYYFYMAWNPRYVLLLATSTLITYLSGVLIHRDSARPDRKKLWVALSFISNLAILFFFKYFYFALDNINHLLGALNITLLQPSFDVLLPVGISFYTFQALSYTVDVYRGDVACEKNPFKYALFVSFFPQLVAGPIERSSNLLGQLFQRHRFEYERVKNGLLLMLWGFFQKLVVADRVAILVDEVFNHYPLYQGFEIVLGLVMFSFQIYGDFAGYSNIAIGASQVMGIQLMDNFRQPLFATSVRDFWARWHISLSTWFRDYLYIPLGGSRKGKLRKYINIMITFLASGLWHGASWNFVAWGGLNGLWQVIGEATTPAKNRLYARMGARTNTLGWRLGKMAVTWGLMCFSWYFFRGNGVMAGLAMMRQTVAVFNPWVLFDHTFYKMGLDRVEFWVAIFAIGVMLLADVLQSRMNVRAAIGRQPLPMRWAFYLAAVAAVLVLGVYGPNYQTANFYYFQF